MSFAGNMNKNIGKNISENASIKCNWKLLDHAKQSATDALKTTSKRVIHKQQKEMVTWIAIKLLIKLQKSRKFTTE